VNTRQRIVISVLLAASIVGLVVAFQSAQEPDDRVVLRDSRVNVVFPPPGDSILKQDTIYAEIELPHTGVLLIDGVEIEASQLQTIQVGNATRLSYTPRPETQTGYLATGSHKATVEFWLPAQGRARSSRYSWEFRVRS
jgi:hypothetical protein